MSELLVYIPACTLYCSNLSTQVIYVHEHLGAGFNYKLNPVSTTFQYPAWLMVLKRSYKHCLTSTRLKQAPADLSL